MGLHARQRTAFVKIHSLDLMLERDSEEYGVVRQVAADEMGHISSVTGRILHAIEKCFHPEGHGSLICY